MDDAVARQAPEIGLAKGIYLPPPAGASGDQTLLGAGDTGPEAVGRFRSERDAWVV